jgi:general secretion pathway protein A
LGVLTLAILLWYGVLPPPASVQPSASAKVDRRTDTALLAGPTAAPVSGEHAGSSSTIPLDTLLKAGTATAETAFKGLFLQWGVKIPTVTATSACALAQQAGLRCLNRSGTWSHLRTFNRPAVIELIANGGRSHHVLVSALGGDYVTVEVSGKRHQLALADVDRLWYGDYTLLWRSRLLDQGALRRGLHGPAVQTLRSLLGIYTGESTVATGDDRFDERLEQAVMEFQRAHRLAADGVVGELTALYLSSYDRDALLPSLALPGAR